MKISVIIPTYKPKDYLWECLDSLDNQTFSKEEFEIILVLNGCKEPYESQIRDNLAKHPDLQVVFIQTDEGGVSNARNLALDVVRGEFITFIDDDDFVSPHYLEELYSVSSEDTIGICYPYAFIDGKLDKQVMLGMNRSYNKLAIKGKQYYPRSRKFFSGPWMKLIPTSFIHGRRFDKSFSNCEDSLFMFLISDDYQFVQYTAKDAIYYRRIRENSATTSNRSLINKIKNLMRVICVCVKIYYRGGYSLNFFITRVLAAIKSILISIYESLKIL